MRGEKKYPKRIYENEFCLWNSKGETHQPYEWLDRHFELRHRRGAKEMTKENTYNKKKPENMEWIELDTSSHKKIYYETVTVGVTTRLQSYTSFLYIKHKHRI